VNLRDAAYRLGPRLARWRTWLARHGFTGPVWVTETGYPADPAYQRDPAFVGGEGAQAAFLTESVLSLVEAGAGEVFVTLRDNLWELFLTEGVITVGDQPPYAVRRKPAFAAMRRLVDSWDRLVALRLEQRAHEETSRRLSAQAAAVARKTRALRPRVRVAKLRLALLRALHRDAEPGARARLARRVSRADGRLRRCRTELAWIRALAADYRRRAASHRLHAASVAASIAGR
jgi:hypothetical protein